MRSSNQFNFVFSIQNDKSKLHPTSLGEPRVSVKMEEFPGSLERLNALKEASQSEVFTYLKDVLEEKQYTRSGQFNADYLTITDIELVYQKKSDH